MNQQEVRRASVFAATTLVAFGAVFAPTQLLRHDASARADVSKRLALKNTVRNPRAENKQEVGTTKVNTWTERIYTGQKISVERVSLALDDVGYVKNVATALFTLLLDGKPIQNVTTSSGINYVIPYPQTADSPFGGTLVVSISQISSTGTPLRRRYVDTKIMVIPADKPVKEDVMKA